MAYRPVKTKDARTVQPFDSTIIVSPPSKSNQRYFHGFGLTENLGLEAKVVGMSKWKASNPYNRRQETTIEEGQKGITRDPRNQKGPESGKRFDREYWKIETGKKKWKGWKENGSILGSPSYSIMSKIEPKTLSCVRIVARLASIRWVACNVLMISSPKSTFDPSRKVKGSSPVGN